MSFIFKNQKEKKNNERKNYNEILQKLVSRSVCIIISEREYEFEIIQYVWIVEMEKCCSQHT